VTGAPKWCSKHNQPYRQGQNHCRECENEWRKARALRWKYPVVRGRLIIPPRRGGTNCHGTVCDVCPAGKLRCEALAHSGGVLPCENADKLDVARMTQLYGADGAQRLLEVGNESAV